MGLSPELLRGIASLGFENPTPIQQQVIPVVLNSESDIVGLAQTGTGKTAAFGLPIIENTDVTKNAVQALIITPTRELCIQIARDMENFSKYIDGLKIAAVYGGASIDTQIKQLKKGVHIIAATPGRMLDLIKRNIADISQITTLVLDEADEMLNMGFREELDAILENAPEKRRTLLFSATMPKDVARIAKNYMNNPVEITVGKQNSGAENVRHIYYQVHARDRYLALKRIADINPDIYGIVFCRTRMETKEVADKLIKDGYNADALHGDLSQAQRDQVMKRFRNRALQMLVATDVAARGIDVDDLTHVINYSIPQNPEAYIHRIGRTGRAGRNGTAITFITPSEFRKLMRIQQKTKVEIRHEKLPKVKNVIRKKRERIIEKIADIIENGKYQDNLPVAYELLSKYNADDVVAALMTHAYKDEFSEEKYAHIDLPLGRSSRRERNDYSPENNGKTRLFIALGKSDNMNPKKLVEKIHLEAQVDRRDIRGVKIYDNFSFANVPFEIAEVIIDAFRKKGRNNKPLITMAKEKDDSSKSKSGNSGKRRRRNQ